MSQDQKIRELFINRLDLFTFEMCLQKYVDIVNPLARPLWSSESLQANAADVYKKKHLSERHLQEKLQQLSILDTKHL